MKNRIIEIIKEFKEVADWTISKLSISKNELYLIIDKTEAERVVKSDKYTVVLYVDKVVNDKKMRGMSYQTFTADLSEEEIRKLIGDAVFAASLALNPHYELEENTQINIEYQACDEFVFENPTKAISEIKYQILKGIDREDGVKMASAEVFITCSKSEFHTSRGLSHSTKKTRIMLEMVMLTGENGNEVESSLIRNERYLEILNIPNLIEEYAEHARNSLEAKLPESGKFDVIFTGEALSEFFNYYIVQCSGSSAYYKTSKFVIENDVVSDVKGEKITIFSDPSVKGGLLTGKYDSYGTLLKKYPIIENGKFVNIAANKQYATYLNIPAIGSVSNINVSAGKQSIKDLLNEKTYVLSRFSTFEPNGTTGAFSGEIRSGYFIKNGKKIQVKGGSVTGLMDNAMKEVYFSKEIIQEGKYIGPKFIKVCNLDIAGK